jgi:HAE1 family hydrophobic/amphiphilic exporter-1
MTGLSTSLGAAPLVIATGAGAEGRQAIGLVVLFGVTIATFTTLLVVPGTYGLVARFGGSPQRRARALAAQLGEPEAAAVGGGALVTPAHAAPDPRA